MGRLFRGLTFGRGGRADVGGSHMGGDGEGKAVVIAEIFLTQWLGLYSSLWRYCSASFKSDEHGKSSVNVGNATNPWHIGLTHTLSPLLCIRLFSALPKQNRSYKLPVQNGYLRADPRLQ